MNHPSRKPQVFRDSITAELAAVRSDMLQLMRSSCSPVNEAVEYVCRLSGKMLRPGLLLTIADSGKATNVEQRRVLSVAVEALHIATLLHDDVLDESDMRRHCPTVARLFGDRSSILLGDYFYSRAFGLMAEAGEFEALSDIVQSVSVCLQGELCQQSNLCNFSLTMDEYMQTIEMKTAEMFSTACKLGARVGGYSEGEVSAISDFGRQYGCGYQVIDDVLDFTGHKDRMGKPVGQDLAQGIVTLPTIFAHEKCADWPDGGKALDGQADRQRIDKLREIVVQSDALTASLSVAEKCLDDARHCLEPLATSAEGLVSDLTALCDATLRHAQDAFSVRERPQTKNE